MAERARGSGNAAQHRCGYGCGAAPAMARPCPGVPNGFLRSALFGAIAKGRRRYINGEDLAALDGVTIRYKGERLDQGDLDVWESVLHAVRFQELGSQCRVTSYALLKLMGKTDTGKNRATLHNRIERLVANAVTVKQGRYTYIGGLIRFAAKDEETQEWVIELDEKLRPLFAGDQFTQIEWAVRHALDGQQLAQWLHGFYATHAKPFPIKVETLRRLSGSETKELFHYRAELRDALTALERVQLVLPPGDAELGFLGVEGDRAARNRLQVRWLANQCAKWIGDKVDLRRAAGPVPQGAAVIRNGQEAAGAGGSRFLCFQHRMGSALLRETIELDPGFRVGR